MWLGLHYKYPEYSLITTQGLSLWAALRCSLTCRNDLQFKGQNLTHHSCVSVAYQIGTMECDARNFDGAKRSFTPEYPVTAVASQGYSEPPPNVWNQKNLQAGPKDVEQISI
uniref:Uncharacterized protein n=1 Tax=Eutreptiella gymnastica TaxID=73025 RepID=A0A7S1NFV8_9EUGL|mmetsp:Transcript_2930/g.5158  ORF Transcript_2930/g.5158 Transcript_2930/m.5158 type:complete len:112 (+) Transcript_2930:160-495(+)